MNVVEKIVLDKKQTAFIGRPGSNGVGVVSGSVEDIASVLRKHVSAGCEIVFSVQNAKNQSRTMASYVKRARQIAELAGVQLSEATTYTIRGFEQYDKFVMKVL